MNKPELVFIVGCNAAGKSTFIRGCLNKLEEFEIFMTDVYKGRTKDLVKQAIGENKNILIETVFNDESFKDLVDNARDKSYQTSLIVLFLDNLQQSVNRVAFRGEQQNGLSISGSNVKINFNESFKNVANYFFYFDQADFIYTGVGGVNRLIMSFNKSKIISYQNNDLVYPQKFADYSFHKQRLGQEAYEVIKANQHFQLIHPPL